jgi:hypothetical protein
VRAILDGRKTQTRRVVKAPGISLDPLSHDYADGVQVLSGGRAVFHGDRGWSRDVPCPYGQPGDHLWVRESAWYDIVPSARDERCFFERGDVVFRSGERGKAPGLPQNSCAEVFNLNSSLVKRPSIHMPRWASRITLEITSIRVERIQDIGFEDAMAEGSPDVDKGLSLRGVASYAQANYRALWNELNLMRGYGWDVNPWVWVVEFKRLAI